jgi:hypothetical protein
MTAIVLAETVTLPAQSEDHLVGEWTTEDATFKRTLKLIISPEHRPLPTVAIRKYAEHAVQHRAQTKQYEDGSWFVTATGFDGPWADGLTEQEALHELVDVIYEWAILKLRDGDRDLPILPDVFDLNSI